MRSVGVLISISRITDRLFEFHPLPVRIQFVRKNERDGSAAAGAHLRPVRHHVDGSVGVDSDERAGMQDGAIGMSSSPGLGSPQFGNQVGNQAHTQDQGAGRNHSLQKIRAG